MFSPKTVFVVGAGASAEVNLPIGRTLRERIADIVEFRRNQGFVNQYMAHAVNKLAGGQQHLLSNYFVAAELISNGVGHVASIDTFMDMHRNNAAVVQLGKIAICIAIRQAEQDSSIGHEFGIAGDHLAAAPFLSNKFRDSWFVSFGELLTQNCAFEDVGSIFDNISVITFNYDRCIEYYAENLVARAFGLSSHARDIRDRLEVIHVYGSVGSIGNDSASASFGNIFADYAALANGIMTFTETVDSNTVQIIHDRITEAETIVFLGFGWIPQNVALLGVNHSDARRVFFTTSGISDDDCELVHDDLRKMLKKPGGTGPQAALAFRMFEERGKCASLFQRHWRQLTRS